MVKTMIEKKTSHIFYFNIIHQMILPWTKELNFDLNGICQFKYNIQPYRDTGPRINFLRQEEILL